MVNKFSSSAFSLVQHKKVFSIAFIGILLFSMLLVSVLQPVVNAQSSNLFGDGFENGNFSAWTGTVGAVGV
jgi:hypothetical protein